MSFNHHFISNEKDLPRFSCMCIYDSLLFSITSSICHSNEYKRIFVGNSLFHTLHIGVMKMTNQREKEENKKNEIEAMANNSNRRSTSSMKTRRSSSTCRNRSAIKSRNSNTIDRLYSQGVAKLRSAKEREETQKRRKAQGESRDATPNRSRSTSRSRYGSVRDVSRTRRRFFPHNRNNTVTYTPPRNPRKVIIYSKE